MHFNVVDNLLDSNIIVFVDIRKRDFEFAKNSVVRKRKIYLLIHEPRVVLPSNYHVFAKKFCSNLIRVGGDPTKFEKVIPWPMDYSKLLQNRSDEGKISDRVVMINGNKLSLIAGEKYSLRRNIVRKIDSVDLYGTDWKMGWKQKLLVLTKCIYFTVRSRHFPRFWAIRGWFRSYQHSKGSPEDKFQVLQKYRYSIVIENELNYLSEKIFDCFFAGAIPIYVGPDIKNFGIPEFLVIQVEGKLKSIQKGIDLAKGLDFQKWSSELWSWINLPEVRSRWERQAVYKDFFDSL